MITVTEVSEFTVMPVAALPPNDTPVAPVRPWPLIVTDCPPATAPEVGETPLTVGVG